MTTQNLIFLPGRATSLSRRAPQFPAAQPHPRPHQCSPCSGSQSPLLRSSVFSFGFTLTGNGSTPFVLLLSPQNKGGLLMCPDGTEPDTLLLAEQPA